MHSWIKKHNVTLGLAFGAIGAIAAVFALLQEPETFQNIEIRTDNRDQSSKSVDASQNVSISDITFSSESNIGREPGAASPFETVPQNEDTSESYLDMGADLQENSDNDLGDNPKITESQIAKLTKPNKIEEEKSELGTNEKAANGEQSGLRLKIIAWADTNESRVGFVSQVDGSMEGRFYGCEQDEGHLICTVGVKNLDSDTNQYRVELEKTYFSDDLERTSYATKVGVGRSGVSDDSQYFSIDSDEEKVLEIRFEDMRNVAEANQLFVTLSSAATSTEFDYSVRAAMYELVATTAKETESTDFLENAVLRAECRKTVGGGCTASQEECYTLPKDKYVANGRVSYGSIVNSYGRNAICGVPDLRAYTERQDANGTSQVIGATSICANLHVESGSGESDLDKVFFVACGYSYDIK